MIELASAYLSPARSVSRQGPPGTKLNFRSGKCVAHDPRQITMLLRMPDVTLQVTERYQDHLAGWIAACGEHKPAVAKIALADGTLLEPPHYAFGPVESEPETNELLVSEPVFARPSFADCPTCQDKNVKGYARISHQLKVHGTREDR